jgi:hypothetical protein
MGNGVATASFVWSIVWGVVVLALTAFILPLVKVVIKRQYPNSWLGQLLRSLSPEPSPPHLELLDAIEEVTRAQVQTIQLLRGMEARLAQYVDGPIDMQIRFRRRR